MDALPLLRLDAKDAIRFANARWLELLRETGGPVLTEADVQGRAFAEFAPDVRLAPVFAFAFRRVRETGEAMRVPFRIEGATQRHHMDLHVLPLGDGAVECRYATLLVEVPGPDLLTLCAWCQRVRLPEGVWARRRVLSESLDYFLGDAPRVTHGICPSCTSAMKARLGFGNT
jgi:hypothetical protein